MDTPVTMMEPDAQELIEARMAAMNATIEDLEDTLVLLRQSLHPLPSPLLPTTAHTVPLPIITTAIRDAGETSSGSGSGLGSGSGSKGKNERRESKSALGRVKGRGKAKSVNDIGLSPRRHASSPDISQPLPSPTDSITTTSKSKSKSSKKSSSKHSKRDSAPSSHYLDSYTAPNSTAQSDAEDPSGTGTGIGIGGKGGKEKEKGKRREMLGEKLGVPLTSEQRKGLVRNHSGHGGAKAMLETIFHRRPSHHHRDRATTLSSSSIPTVKSSPSTPPPPLPAHATSFPPPSAADPASHIAPPVLTPEALINDLAKYIANIRHQHSSLLTLLPLSNISHPSSGTETLSSPDEYFSDSLDYISGAAPDHLPKGSGITAGGSTQYHTAKSHIPSRLHHTSRPSLSSMYAEVASIYYDAEIEPWNDDDPDAPTGSRYSVGSRATSLHRASMADVDAHVAEALRTYEEQDQARRQTLIPGDRSTSEESVDRQRTSMETVVPYRVPDGDVMRTTDSEETQVGQPVKVKHVGPVVRRKGLPAASPASEPSLIGMLRKNVGKDMSTISFDVTFNEPISLLQKLAEEVEYYNLLTLAAQAHDPIERIAHVAAFAVSQYANSKHRTSRKPFNPLQGETYELVREDLGMKFVAEKVTHHPPRMACHSEGPGWVYWCTSAAKNKLSGMSLEIQPLGAQYVMLNGKEQYHWTKPPSYMRNLVAGTKYLETIGDLIVTNDTTGERAVINFEAGGWAGKRNVVNGICYSSGGGKAAWIDGVWDSKLSVRYGSSHDPSHPLWLVNPWPPHPEKNYGFTTWAIELNELTPDLPPVLPPSDSRLRPDQRALEEGNFELADRLKNVLEENQRQRRQANGGDVSPRWFRMKNGAGVGGAEEWEYAGGYFEGREEGKLGETGLGGLFEA